MMSDVEPPLLSVDTRLPNPSILTCNEAIPLRILVKKANATAESIFLQMLQIKLIAYTDIRAHDIKHREVGTWVITSQSNLSIPLGEGTDPVGTEWTVQSSLWDQLALPNNVAPSFETCNLSRSYELDVRIGFTHGQAAIMHVCQRPSFFSSFPLFLLVIIVLHDTDFHLSPN